MKKNLRLAYVTEEAKLCSSVYNNMFEQSTIKDFNQLKKNLKKDFSGLKTIKVAVLGDSSTQFLALCTKAYGYEASLNFEVYEADYDQVEPQVLDASSELYAFGPEFIVISRSVKKAYKKFMVTDAAARGAFGDNYISEVERHYKMLTTHSKAKIIYFNFPEYNDGVFGNFANKTSQSFLFQLRKINYRLMETSQACKDLFLNDICLLSAQLGKKAAFDAKMYYNADMVLSLDMLPYVAKGIADIVLSVTGRFKKCIILDLDNTTWGGIIGDDGIEKIQVGDLGIGKVFSELQGWVKELKARGIIVAVCSKNNEATAKEPFEKHPDMVLRLEDISVFVANWNNKADNIRHIQSILNIGFDSMVFVDDNPFERNIVRENLPEVCVPELPEDPAMYLDHLIALNLFETASFSELDAGRTKQYQEESVRAAAKQNFTDENDFLSSLGMVSEVSPFDKFSTPRVAQLSQRSNQFNLRTVRYTDADIEKLTGSQDHLTLSFNLKDKFGDNGLICAVILKKESDHLFIDSWFMSCRVLKRGMEGFTLNTLVKAAQALGYKTIKGEYLPTAKNAMVKDHYQDLGFSFNNGLWELDTTNYETNTCFITEINKLWNATRC